MRQCTPTVTNAQQFSTSPLLILPTRILRKNLKVFWRLLNKTGTHRFARPEAVFDIALEYNTVGFCESESLIYRLQSVTVGSETWEY